VAKKNNNRLKQAGNQEVGMSAERRQQNVQRGTEGLWAELKVVLGGRV